jgi:predicted ester cyclase
MVHREGLRVVEILDDMYGDGVEIEFEVYFIELRDGKIRSDEAVKDSSPIHRQFIGTCSNRPDR